MATDKSSTAPLTTSIPGLTPSLPHKSQACSPLMQLPAEIRLMILRELLVSETTFNKRSTYDKPIPLVLPKKPVAQPTKQPSKTKAVRVSLPRKAKKVAASPGKKEKVTTPTRQTKVRGYNLYPAVLSTCQQLLFEAWPLLYGNNTLGIYMTPTWNHGYAYTCPCAERAHMSIYAQSSHPLSTIYDSFQLRHTDVAFASRFDHYQVEAAIRSDDFTYRSARMMVAALRDLLKGKSLQVVISNAEKLLNNSIQGFINAFQLVRCKKITMAGIGEITSKRICAVIMSNEAIVDLDEPMSKLRNFCALVSYDSRRIAGIDKDLLEAEKAVKNFDPVNFAAMRTKITKAVEKDFAQRMQETEEAALYLP
ncbi:hypothetical protein PMZ80_006773 [Knufia obscura]|uniref:Uncharacterized protein n=1 Tax=Knufia obscura TaxID=1635080 RepID=A0ABR0RMP0_9EURO|nr:hypothetical protein PMZ80_006773 [Knufia obscura]